MLELVFDRGSVSQLDRLAIAKLSQEMDSLGCEITSVRPDSGSVGRWQARWRVNDPRVGVVAYGATGDSALDATRAALSNAQSDLGESIAVERASRQRSERIWVRRSSYRLTEGEIAATPIKDQTTRESEVL